MDSKTLHLAPALLLLIVLISACTGDPATAGMDAYEDGKYAEAGKLFNQALEQDESRTDIRFFLGVCQQMKSSHKEAIETYSRVILEDDSAHNALLNRGHCYYALQDWTKALSDYKRTLELKPDEKVVYNPIAHMRFYMGDTMAACAALDSAATVFADRDIDKALREACQPD